MGRTVLPFTQELYREEESWKPFRRALRKEDRELFDELFAAARYHTAACTGSPTPYGSRRKARRRRITGSSRNGSRRRPGCRSRWKGSTGGWRSFPRSEIPWWPSPTGSRERFPPEALAVAKRLSKAPEQYVANTAAAAVTRELCGRGVTLRPGSKIRYLLADGKGRAMGFLDGNETPDFPRYEEMLREAEEELLGLIQG